MTDNSFACVPAYGALPSIVTKYPKDYEETLHKGCEAADDNIWRNTAGISSGTQYASGNLSTSWSSKTGYTYYGLTTSREGTTPTGNEFVGFASQNNFTPGYRPFLTVTHSGSSAKQSRSLWELFPRVSSSARNRCSPFSRPRRSKGFLMRRP